MTRSFALQLQNDRFARPETIVSAVDIKIRQRENKMAVWETRSATFQFVEGIGKEEDSFLDTAKLLLSFTYPLNGKNFRVSSKTRI